MILLLCLIVVQYKLPKKKLQKQKQHKHLSRVINNLLHTNSRPQKNQITRRKYELEITMNHPTLPHTCF